ncbi:tRNA preQ1(34) S-adenosylmethionine ribosyltransferase-isomerase QueA [Candidatus Falkowbacteria bacterium]|nr:tRNA preQ1(34) S-adenosylmethionine ribosyltransferase-isomerase QueA [Candidatus Falkowbacteria bacterium]
MNLKLSDYDFDLPKELIAQTPLEPRDSSRLLVLHRASGRTEHLVFREISRLFKPGDLLVLNDSKVFPARLKAEKKLTGGKLEIFLLREIKNKQWQCLVGGRGAKLGTELTFSEFLSGVLLQHDSDRTWLVEFNIGGDEFWKNIELIGAMPLPPYIKREAPIENDKERYQTVFANDQKQGSVAAPTAGLHFSESVLSALSSLGVEVAHLTLHVGLGTFAPIKTQNVLEHKMHAENYEADKENILKIIEAKRNGRRIIAVGTTATRTLETIAQRSEFTKALENPLDCPAVISGWTDIFIHPGYRFKLVNAMVTNFHTPKSTLMMLVSAFIEQEPANTEKGLDILKKTYEEAILKRYRFFSYGDAMFID